MPAVEEFFNRVHNTNDGRFGTSGTGGGHFAGRAKGAKRPALKSGGGKTATATKSAPTKKGPPPPPPGKSSTGNGFPKPTPGGKPNAAPKRDINAEAKAHVAGVIAKMEAQRAAAKAARGNKPAEKPQSHGDSHDTAKLNEIQKLKQHLQSTKPDAHQKAHDIVQGKMAEMQKHRDEMKAKRGAQPAAAKKSDGGDTAKLNEIQKLRQQLSDHKAAPAGAKPGMNKQDAGPKHSTAPTKKKVKLSERLKNAGQFAKALGDAVQKDHASGSDWLYGRRPHDRGR